MNLFISLGVEVGSWKVEDKQCYFIQLGSKQIQLTKLQSDIYYLGHRAVFTPKRAAETLQITEEAVTTTIKQLIDLNAAMYWGKGLTIEQTKQFRLLPRGMAGKRVGEQQYLLSGLNEEPVVVEAFGHALWMFSNGILSLYQVLQNLAIQTGLSFEDCLAACSYDIPFLIRHGLIIIDHLER